MHSYRGVFHKNGFCRGFVTYNDILGSPRLIAKGMVFSGRRRQKLLLNILVTFALNKIILLWQVLAFRFFV